ncbi:MAG: extracellular solute-binding protein, partial [Lachnospiraceae bacterium]|nr:extracellular solute-binding protein [Lachnospiraceae bacterium]
MRTVTQTRKKLEKGVLFVKKKLLSILLSATLAISTFAGCGASGSGSGSGTASGGDNGGAEEITWMFWDDLNATEDLISLGYKDVIDRFNKDYEGVYHVTPVTTNLEEYYTKLNALVASGETPDCFIVSPGPNLTTYVDPGVAADLTPYLEADGWKDTFSSDSVFSQQTYDGKIYAVPLNIAAACVFYNTEMFEKAGVEVPKTWDELLAACDKLQKAGYTPITISAGTAWCLSMLCAYLMDREGASLADMESGKESWVNDKTIDVGNKMLELSKYFQPTAAGDTNDVATAAFYNEEA